MKTKIALLAFAVAAGVFAFTRTYNAPPRDFRDAPADTGGSGTFNTGLPAIEEANPGLPVPKAEMVGDLPDQASRYVIYHPAEGTSVTVDNITKLMWVTDPAGAGIGGQYAWAGAKEACEKLAYAGHGDWRLPGAAELASIADNKHSAPAVDSQYFPNTRSLYWTSHESQSGDSAWSVNFNDGSGSNVSKAVSGSIRCVRAASPSTGANSYTPVADPGKTGPAAQSRGDALRQGVPTAGAHGSAQAHIPGLAAAGPAGAEKSASAEAAGKPVNPSAVAGVAAVGLDVVAGVNFLNALALQSQALSMAQTATTMAAQARAAAAAGQLAKAQQLGAQAKAIGAGAKETGAQATGAAHSGVVMTVIGGGIMVADGIWNIHSGLKEGRELKEELLAADAAIGNLQDPAALEIALTARDALQERADKARELVVVGGVKTGAGGLQLGSLLVAPTLAPFLLAAGAIGYIGAVIYQHRDAIKEFFRKLFGKSATPELKALAGGGTGLSAEPAAPDTQAGGYRALPPEPAGAAAPDARAAGEERLSPAQTPAIEADRRDQ